MKNTTTTTTGIEVYENQIWQLVDEYIDTVLHINQNDYDSIEKYKKEIANNRIDLFFYISDRIEKPNNNDIELLDNIFNIYIRVCGRYGISPTLQMFGILVGINNMTFSDWANGDYRTTSTHGITVKKWKETCGAFALDKLHNQDGTNANLIFACKVAYGMAETAPVQAGQQYGVPQQTAQQIAEKHKAALQLPEMEKPEL
nr:MAG TPA: hypothetical protein [Caudoviricetes sp.]